MRHFQQGMGDQAGMAYGYPCRDADTMYGKTHRAELLKAKLIRLPQNGY
jgi:hypothetical protein